MRILLYIKNTVRRESMNNVIIITLDDTQAEHNFNVKFQNDPSLSELITSKLILEEILEHNFSKSDILLKQGIIYGKIRDIEELRRKL
jgi:hypothetical protein